MRHVLFLLPTKDFRDADYTEPSAALQSEGHPVTVAAGEWRCEGSLGTVVTPHILYRNVNQHDFDALYIVGGVGAKEFSLEITVIDLVKSFAHEGKIIAATDQGVLILAAADLLAGRFVATLAGDQDFVIGKGGRLSRKNLVVDGNIVTAVGHEAAGKIGQTLTNLLA